MAEKKSSTRKSSRKKSTDRKNKTGATRKKTSGRKIVARRKPVTTRRKAATTKRAGVKKKTGGKSNSMLDRFKGSMPKLGGGKNSKKKAPSKKKSKQKSPASVTPPAARIRAIPPMSRSVSAGMSLDRKLDIIGIILAVVGMLTMISLFTLKTSSIVGFWVMIVRRGFGWGGFILAAAWIGIGVWLIIRNFEKVPNFAMERLIGIILLFVNILIWLHWFLGTENSVASYAAAALGQGGGYLGAFFFEMLYGGLGYGGAVVAVVGWAILGLAMALDVGVIELFQWVPKLMMRLQDTWDEYQSRSKSHESANAMPTGVASAPMNPQPLPTSAQGSAMAHPMPPGMAAGTNTPIPGQPEIRIGITMDELEPQNWVLPQVSEMLFEGDETTIDDEFDRERAQLIEETLGSFGAPVNVVEINRGPTITQFGVEPAFLETSRGRTRVRVNKISGLADDLALALAASRIRIQAPVPGRGFVGIEVPNDQIAVVALRDVLESDAFKKLKSNLRFALGQDVAGNAVSVDLAAMPHLLVAGATGSGKSVCVNAIIASMLLNNTPAELRMIMVDPKRVELTGYNGIPHLLAPVVTEIDRVVGVLQWVEREMDSRYQRFADMGARNLTNYNKQAARKNLQTLPHLVLVIDELADMMMVAPDQTERYITRLAQLARATGIHLIISTQRPSVDVVTGLIKANFPARIAFAVASGTDSRVILDQPGAERLLGRGDMLFLAPDAPAPVRLQGVFVSDDELLNIVEHWRGFAGTTKTAHVATSSPMGAPVSSVPLKQMEIWEEMEEEKDGDPIYKQAIEIVRSSNRASISSLQRRLRIGYTRAARIIDQMEEDGLIGPSTGNSSAREVYSAEGDEETDVEE